MQSPMDPVVAELVALLDDNLTELFLERAAVREFDGGLGRPLGEALGLLDVINRHPEALSRATVVLVEVKGQPPHFYVTTDIDLAREQAAKAGGTEVRTSGVAWTVDEEFGGLAEIKSVG